MQLFEMQSLNANRTPYTHLLCDYFFLVRQTKHCLTYARFYALIILVNMVNQIQMAPFINAYHLSASVSNFP